VKIGDLTPRELHIRLAGSGIGVELGPFIALIKTSIPHVSEAFRFLYCDYPIAPADSLIDYRVNIARSGGIRRWFRPQACMDFDGIRPYYPLPLQAAVPLLEWSLNWSVFTHAHQYLMIHAAVLEREGRALLIPAPSGSGKSTLCAGLACSGWRLLTDELALISPDDAYVTPIPRPVSLKNESIGLIREFAPHAAISRAWTDPVNGLIAYLRPPASALLGARERAQPALVVFARYDPASPAGFESVTPARAFMRLADNAVNYSVLGSRGFEALANVIDKVRCFSYSYGKLDDAVENFNRLIEQTTAARA
jgi:HprK-related kinase A